MTIQQDIFAHLEPLLLPASLPAPWQQVPATPDYRAPLQDFRAAVNMLLEKFSVDDLVSSGVLIRQRVGARVTEGLGINPRLVIGNLLLLRSNFGQPPYEIVSSGGCVSGSHPPVIAALDDVATQCQVRFSGGNLFATCGIEPAAIFQALGFPAMPASDLAKLKGCHFDRFCDIFDVRHQHGADGLREDEEEEEEEEEDYEQYYEDDGDQAGDGDPDPGDHGQAGGSPLSPGAPPPSARGQSATASPGRSPPAAEPQRRRKPVAPWRLAIRLKHIRLCLVAWSLAELSLAVPEQLAAIDARLRELASKLNLLMDQIDVWRPATGLGEQVRFALTNDLHNRVRPMLISSHESSTGHLVLPEADPIRQPASLRGVFETLRQSSGDGINGNASLQEFRNLVDAQVAGPLFERAEAETDPVLKVQAMIEACCLTRKLDFLPLLVQPQHRPGNGPLRPKEFEDLNAEQECLANLLKPVDPAQRKDAAGKPRSKPTRPRS